MYKFLCGQMLSFLLDTHLGLDLYWAMWLADVFFHWVGIFFIFLMLSFDTQKFFILMKSSLPTFSFIPCAFGIIFKKSLPKPRSQRFTPVFSDKNFIVFAFTFRSLIHFELISCVWC